MGNLTRDPELKVTTGGMSISTFGLATNRRARKDDKWVDVPEFHHVVVYGKQAEDCAKYLTKGSLAHVEGRIQTRSWEAPEKGKQYRTEIVAERVTFGPKNAPKAGDDVDQRPEAERAAESAPAPQTVDEWEPNPEDIPF